MKAFIITLFGFLSIALLSFVPGCGGSSHHTLFLISAGAPAVGALEIGGSGALTLNNTTFSTGADPRGIVIDSKHRYCYVLNNAGPGIVGGVFQYTIDRGHGTIAIVQAPNASSNVTGPVSPAPTGIQPLGIAMDPGDNFVFVANSGSDSVSVYSLDQTDGALKEVTGSPFPTASKPVSLVARGTSLFVADQGAGSISSYSFDGKTGALTVGSTTPVGANTTSITADPSGKQLFVADGTANTVAAFSISGTTLAASGTPTTVGTAPSNLYIDPSGKYLYVANSGSNNLSAFTIGSGSLSEISGSPFATGTAPSFVTSKSDGSVLFVANQGSANVSAFRVNSGGGLTAASGSPYATSGFSSPDGLASAE